MLIVVHFFLRQNNTKSSFITVGWRECVLLVGLAGWMFGLYGVCVSSVSVARVIMSQKHPRKIYSLFFRHHHYRSDAASQAWLDAFSFMRLNKNIFLSLRSKKTILIRRKTNQKTTKQEQYFPRPVFFSSLLFNIIFYIDDIPLISMLNTHTHTHTHRKIKNKF